MPKVVCIKCSRVGNLTRKKTKSYGKTYEYWYVQHYIKETDKIEWCYLGRFENLPHKYKQQLMRNTQKYTQRISDTQKIEKQELISKLQKLVGGRSSSLVGQMVLC